ncbi:hypothetical protein NE237_012074 [Protea cynaroides]|uniref:Cytochrome P450 n=1 Tax=Protea cynaroides TaxID=273540 RepID=A0A9Q0JXB1_9MAGN|nr:hypothetical protein NE237_012074 [Protea cynaroides]
MEFNFQLQVVALFVALVLLYSPWRVPSGALPILGHLHLLGRQMTIHRTLGAIADKYGPAFMLQLDINRTLVVSSWEMMKDCFSTNDRAFATQPFNATGKHLGYDHAMMGKIATIELLSKTRLEKLKHVRINEIDEGIKELYSLWSKNDKGTHVEKEMKQWFQHLSFNIKTKIIAGKRYFGDVNAEHKVEVQRFKKEITKLVHLAGVFVLSDALPYLKWLDLGGYLGAMKSVANELDSLIGNWLEEHRSKAQSGKKEGEVDFIDVMLSIIHVHDKDLKYSHDRDTISKATIWALIAAGSETTSLSLTWALFLLLNNSHILKKAQHELDSHVGRDRHETLRLYPAAPIALPHEAMEDSQAGGYHVPKGTQLLANIWKLQRDPRRFLTTHANVDVRGQQFEFIPFGLGVQSCPGVTFAMQVLHLTLARLIHGFNLETPSNGPIDMSEGLALTLPKKKPCGSPAHPTPSM